MSPEHNWQDYAFCKGMDRDIFFSAEITKPKKICAQCGVQEICLWFTMMLEEPWHRYGVFGSLSAVARQRLGQSISQEQAATFYNEDVRLWRAEMRQLEETAA